MKFPKKQAQRLIPEYLLDYTTKLNESHPDPTESWGGGSGGTYTAGDGININENVISVDNTIAKKSEIPTNYVTLDTEQTITKPKTITSRLTVGDVNGSNIFIDAKYGTGKGQLINMYNDTLGSEFAMMIDSGNVQGNTGAYFTYEDDKGLREYRLPYQDREGLTTCTLATNLDIPTKTSELTNDSGYATQTWVENQGYSKFSGSYNDLNDKPDLSIYAQTSNLSKVATSGSYNDLTDKPTIPDTTNLVTTNTDQTISGAKTFDGGPICSSLGGAYTMQPLGVGVLRFNDVNSTKQISFSLPIEKSGTEYTIATTDDIPTSATSTSTVTPTTETLVFTLADNSTVEVNVMTSATVSTTTTLS